MTKADRRRLRVRDELWPDAESLVGKSEEKGWWRATRVLPLLLTLARDKRITGNLDCSSVYLELLSRDFGQGLVEVLDEDEHAFFAGYRGKRATRSWRERVIKLEQAGFLKVASKGNRKLGFVLLLNPHRVAVQLREAGKIDEDWWRLYRNRLEAVGAELGPVLGEEELLQLGELEEESGVTGLETLRVASK